jgi:hypothetical protein
MVKFNENYLVKGDYYMPVVELDKSKKGKERAAKAKALAKKEREKTVKEKVWYIQAVPDEVGIDQDCKLIAQLWMIKISYHIKILE